MKTTEQDKQNGYTSYTPKLYQRLDRLAKTHHIRSTIISQGIYYALLAAIKEIPVSVIISKQDIMDRFNEKREPNHFINESVFTDIHKSLLSQGVDIPDIEEFMLNFVKYTHLIHEYHLVSETTLQKRIIKNLNISVDCYKCYLYIYAYGLNNYTVLTEEQAYADHKLIFSTL